MLHTLSISLLVNRRLGIVATAAPKLANGQLYKLQILSHNVLRNMARLIVNLKNWTSERTNFPLNPGARGFSI